MSATKSLKLQTVFDIVVTHLYRQGRSSREAHNCLYRGPDGTSCAVGCLIDDEQYSRDMEGKSVLGLSIAHTTFTPKQLDLLVELQDVHDRTRGLIGDSLRKVASRFGLAYREEHYPTAPTDWNMETYK